MTSTSAQQAQQAYATGLSLLERRNAPQALASFRQALELFPETAALHVCCGFALSECGHFQEAVDSFDRAIRINPGMGDAHNNRGNALLRLGRFREAVEAFRNASRLLPGTPIPLAACATALLALREVDPAESCCRQALAIAPDFAEAHWNLALCLLLQGRYTEGWREYEWRWRKEAFTSPRRHTGIPLWDGTSPAGRRILLHAEQGFGDAVQFVRYAPLVAQMGANVVLQCHSPLVPLFRQIDGLESVIPFHAAPPPCDWQVPLLTLPLIFGTTLASIPHALPYLSPPPERTALWAHRMAAYTAQPRIGLVWEGKSHPDPLRSCRLADFAPLAGIGDLAWFSLQLGSGSSQAVTPPDGMTLVDLTPHIRDFADTAALIGQLDMVISIDTAVAHLAGALGIPAIVLLPFAPDWRWLLHRDDSPWYPGMRLIRQEIPDEWGGCMLRVRALLEQEFVTVSI